MGVSCLELAPVHEVATIDPSTKSQPAFATGDRSFAALLFDRNV